MCDCTPDRMCDHHQREFDRQCDEFLTSLTNKGH